MTLSSQGSLTYLIVIHASLATGGAMAFTLFISRLFHNVEHRAHFFHKVMTDFAMHQM